MPTSDRSYAGQLARTVIKELRGVRFHVSRWGLPKLKTLIRLFETMYAVSLRTEEAQSVRCSVALMDPSYWLGDAPRRGRGVRCYPLSQPPPEPMVVEFPRFPHLPRCDEQNLRKLARASDPSTSVIVVGPDRDGSLVIFGMLDQILHYSRFLARQGERSARLPGVLLCAIEGQGRLSVYKAFQFVAGLNQTKILKRLPHPLAAGPIRKTILNGSSSIVDTEIAVAIDYVKQVAEGVPPPKRLRAYFQQKWISTISRLIQQIQRYGHGATLLVMPPTQRSVEGQLDIKYPIRYGRIVRAFALICRIEAMRMLGLRSAHRLMKRKDKAAAREGKGLREFWDSERPDKQLRQANAELEGAISFVASLSRVDGLVLCDEHLNVTGFGAEIRVCKDPADIYLARDAFGKSLIRGDMSSYGTRHRSVMRFCWANPGTIGFVISHDGDLRAILRVGKKLLMWDNVDHRQLWTGEKWA